MTNWDPPHIPIPTGRRSFAEIVNTDDQTPAASRYIGVQAGDGTDLLFFAEVRHGSALIGVLVMRGTTGHTDGRIRCAGVSLFTRDELIFGELES